MESICFDALDRDPCSMLRRRSPLQLWRLATPERKVIFSVNDLDETLPGPWEWDVKRLAVSFVVACRDNNLSEVVAKDVVMTCVRTYRESLAEFSQLKTLEVWYQALDADKLVANIKDTAFRQRALKRLQKERAKSIAEDIFPKLVEHRGEMPVIKDQLPTIFHKKDTPPGKVPNPIMVSLAKYRETLPTAYQSLLNRYQIRDAAIKVVGIGRSELPAGCSSLRQGRVIRFSFRSRKRAPRCWNRTPARVSSPITVSALSTATVTCSPQATCSSVGDKASAIGVTISSVS